MSRISLQQLRELANEDLLDLIEQDAMFAVLEVLEAAQAHIVARRDKLPSEWPRLLDALARFDFGDDHAG